MSDWKSAPNASIYLPTLNAAEDTYAIPPDLLARIAYEESHFRADIVNCQTVSPAGAVGLMQLLPQYFSGAGVNWKDDVATAGTYLANLHKRFNDWQMAVAAYNWGPGNVSNYNGGHAQMPQETKDYIAQIFADVPVVGALV